MIISNSKNFIYIHIEKTGGTSIEEAILPYLDPTDIILGGISTGNKKENEIYKRYGYEYVQQNMLWKHADANKIKSFIGNKWNDMYKFATVRDPIDIMISFYYYIDRNLSNYKIPNDFENIVLDKELKKEIVISDKKICTDDIRNYYFLESKLNNTGIDGFIQKMILANLKEISPQSLKIDDSVELYDISQLNNKWNDIVKKINIPAGVELFKLNKSNNTGNIELSTKTISMIKDHFHIDYKNIPMVTGLQWK